jgi:hypothetical protein
MKSGASEVLLLFVKNARLGKVKSRLAAKVGEERALKIYLALLEHTRQVALSVPVERHIYYSDYPEPDDAWQSAHFSKKIQRGKDIGERMANAFDEALCHSEKAVLVGSDIPGLSAGILKEAFDKLDDFDLVLGPAEDGGYYLIGMKTPQPHIFRQIDWGTAAVFEQTLKVVEDSKKKWYRLPTLSDVDYEEDWLKHGWEI